MEVLVFLRWTKLTGTKSLCSTEECIHLCFNTTISRGGTYYYIFLNIVDIFDPQVFSGVVLCIKNEIIFFKCQN